MKPALFILFVATLFCLAASPALAQDGGKIQINCEAGVTVFLDGGKKGVTADKGLLLDAVAAGAHKVSLEKEGCHAQEFEVTVEAGKIQVLSVRVAGARR